MQKVRNFVEEEGEVRPTARVAADKLLDRWKRWAVKNGYPVTMTTVALLALLRGAFGRKIESKRITEYGKKMTVVFGIGLLPSPQSIAELDAAEAAEEKAVANATVLRFPGSSEPPFKRRF
jgi:hypothetical protein